MHLFSGNNSTNNYSLCLERLMENMDFWNTMYFLNREHGFLGNQEIHDEK